MSLEQKILEQVRSSVENLVEVATGGLEKRVEELEAKVAKLENAAKTAPARAAREAKAAAAEATGTAHK